jgi:hypothetical protein
MHCTQLCPSPGVGTSLFLFTPPQDIPVQAAALHDDRHGALRRRELGDVAGSLKMNARFAVPMTGKTKWFQRAFISKFD